MPAGVNLQFSGKSSEERKERNEAIVGGDHPPPVGDFSFQNPAIQTSILFVLMRRRGVQLRLNLRRNERKSINLAMRVRHRDSDFYSGVFEHLDVLNIGMRE